MLRRSARLRFALPDQRGIQEKGRIAMRKSGERMTEKRNEGQRGSERGAVHPAIPAVLMLVAFAVFMAAIAPLDFSAMFRKLFPPAIPVVPHKQAAVWVNRDAGVYYCSNSVLFGKVAGAYMTQVGALDHGYQPALGTYCGGPAMPQVTSEATVQAGPQAQKPAKPAASAPVPPATNPSIFENPNYRPQDQKAPGSGTQTQTPLQPF